jgi:hypothetical protein
VCMCVCVYGTPECEYGTSEHTMHTYIHIYIYIHTYIHTLSTLASIHTYIYTYIHTYIPCQHSNLSGTASCLCLHLYKCVYICIYVCMYVTCMRYYKRTLLAHVCACMRVDMDVRVHARIAFITHIHVCVVTKEPCLHMCVYAHAYCVAAVLSLDIVNTHKQRICVQTHVYVYKYTYMCTNTTS